jgi:cytoskeletal protein CcmA (bactofilin family)
MFGSSKKSEKQLWNAFFSSNVEIEGTLRFTGLLNIDGRLRGAIIAKGMLVTGVNAYVEGDVFVENLVLSGTIIGNIFATGEVHLNQSAVVRGNINYHTLSIVPGAVHEGNSHFFSEEERVELAEKIKSDIVNIENQDPAPEEKKNKKRPDWELDTPKTEEPLPVMRNTQDEDLVESKQTVSKLNVLNNSLG